MGLCSLVPRFACDAGKPERGSRIICFNLLFLCIVVGLSAQTPLDLQIHVHNPAGIEWLQACLLGASTTEVSTPKMLGPEESQFEDVIRSQLAGEKNCPPWTFTIWI